MNDPIDYYLGEFRLNTTTVADINHTIFERDKKKKSGILVCACANTRTCLVLNPNTPFIVERSSEALACLFNGSSAADIRRGHLFDNTNCYFTMCALQHSLEHPFNHIFAVCSQQIVVITDRGMLHILSSTHTRVHVRVW